MLPYTNIYIDNNIEYSLLFLTLLVNKKNDFKDLFNHNSMIELKLNMKLVLILRLFKLLFLNFWKKNISILE